MRSDATCPDCGRPVRRAIHVMGQIPLLLEPKADPSGRYGVVAWRDTDDVSRSIPVIATNPTKTETPCRYDVHRCRT